MLDKTRIIILSFVLFILPLVIIPNGVSATSTEIPIELVEHAVYEYPRPLANSANGWNTPAMDTNGITYFSSRQNSVVAVKPDGTLFGSHDTSMYANVALPATNYEPTSPIVLDGNYGYVGLLNGSILCFHKTTFERVWWGMGTSFTAVAGSPVIVGSSIISATKGGTIFALNKLSGALIWENTSYAGFPINCNLVSDGTNVFFGASSVNVSVFALAVSDGTESWNYTMHNADSYIFAGITYASDGKLYFGDTRCNLYCLSALGVEQWKITPLVSNSKIVTNVYVDSYIWLTTYHIGLTQHRIISCDKATGAIIDNTILTGKEPINNFAVVGDWFYVYDRDPIKGVGYGYLEVYNRTLDLNSTLSVSGEGAYTQPLVYPLGDVLALRTNTNYFIQVGSPNVESIVIEDKTPKKHSLFNTLTFEDGGDKDGYFLEGTEAWEAYGVRNNALLTDMYGNPVVDDDGYYTMQYSGREISGATFGMTGIGVVKFKRSADKTTITDVEKYVGNPVMHPSDIGWVNPQAQLAPGTVIKRGANDYIAYITGASAFSPLIIYYATSTDGYTWNINTTAIVTGSAYPSATVTIPNVRMLQYGAYAGTLVMFIEVGPKHIGIATSTDWYNWTTPTNPIPIPTSAGYSDVANPRFEELADGVYIMGGNRLGHTIATNYHCTMWQSTNPFSGWVDYNASNSHPIITINPGSGEWDSVRSEQLEFVKSDFGTERIGAFYFGINNTDSYHYAKIGYVSWEQTGSNNVSSTNDIGYSETYTLYCAGWNDTFGLLDPISCSWSLDDDETGGTISTTSGYSTTFTAGTQGGTSVVTASYLGLTDTASFITPNTYSQTLLDVLMGFIPLILIIGIIFSFMVKLGLAKRY